MVWRGFGLRRADHEHWTLWQMRDHAGAAVLRGIADEHDQIGRESACGGRFLAAGCVLHDDFLIAQLLLQGIRERAASDQQHRLFIRT